MKFMFNKSIALVLGLAFLSGPIIALDQKVKDAAIAIATHLKALADLTADQNVKNQAAAGLAAAQKGDLQIPKPARAPKPEEQKSLDQAIKSYENAIVAYANALKASNANGADAGLKSKADIAQGAVGGAEAVLASTIASIK